MALNAFPRRTPTLSFSSWTSSSGSEASTINFSDVSLDSDTEDIPSIPSSTLFNNTTPRVPPHAPLQHRYIRPQEKSYFLRSIMKLLIPLGVILAVMCLASPAVQEKGKDNAIVTSTITARVATAYTIKVCIFL